MKKLLAEFRDFINKGNVMDLAVGVIIANAFGKITTSLVNEVFMPILGCIIGGIDLSALNITIKKAVIDEAGEVTSPAVTVAIGNFLCTIIDFLLVAFIVFLVLKAFNKAQQFAERKKKAEEEAKKAEEEAKAKAEAEAKAAELTREEKLLVEIRDLLKTQQK